MNDIYNDRGIIMDKQEELELVYNWQNFKCNKSRQTLINNHNKLIVYYANKYSRKNIQLQEDLYQEGVIGVLTAIDKIKISKDIKCITYFTYYIKWFMQKYLLKNAGNIRYGDKSNANSKIYFHLYELNGDDLQGFTYKKIKDFSEKYNVSEIEIYRVLNCYAVDINENDSCMDLETGPHNVIEKEEILELIIEKINNFDKNTYISFFRRLNEEILSQNNTKFSYSWDKQLYNKGLSVLKESLNVR